MKRSFLAIAAFSLFAGACATPGPEGYIQLGGWALPKPPVAGYNIYIAEAGAKKYEKVNDQPVVGSTIEINQLKAGKGYYIYMTQVSSQDPDKESRPGKTFKRMAKPRTPDQP